MSTELAAGVSRFRDALAGVPSTERDSWVDRALGLEALPDDGPELPKGCVPYLPCATDTVVRAVQLAGVHAADVFVDIGAGVGRTALLVHLLTGATVIGIEIQPALVSASRDLARGLGITCFSAIEGDAASLTDHFTAGSVFFLYCPFSGPRLEKVLAVLASVARMRPIRICCVDLPLPLCPWLTVVAPRAGDLEVYRSNLLD